MEEEHVNVIQNSGLRSGGEERRDQKSLLSLSFIPPELEGKRGVCEKCAIASVVFGGMSLVTWVIMILGLLMSVVGIVLGIFGLKSQHPKHARIGLILSVIGLLAVILYAVSAARGMIHYSYFTTQMMQ